MVKALNMGTIQDVSMYKMVYLKVSFIEDNVYLNTRIANITFYTTLQISFKSGIGNNVLAIKRISLAC